MPKANKANMQYVTEEQWDILYEKSQSVYIMHVACHELMGHGAGKMFYWNKDGSFNFDKSSVKNLLTGEPVTSWYEEGETWNGKFGDFSTSIEECWADICGFWLQSFPEVYEIFGFKAEDAEQNLYVQVMN